MTEEKKEMQYMDITDLLCQIGEKLLSPSIVKHAHDLPLNEKTRYYFAKKIGEILVNTTVIYQLFRGKGFTPIESTVKTRSIILDASVMGSRDEDISKIDLNSYFLSPEENLKRHKEKRDAGI